METAMEFFKLFFTAQMVKEIVDHTNSYAVEHITEGSHRTYAQPDGSWKDTMLRLSIFFSLAHAFCLPSFIRLFLLRLMVLHKLLAHTVSLKVQWTFSR